MVRRFKIIDPTNKNAYMGEVQYNTSKDEFRVLVLDDYTGKYPDHFMMKFKGSGELPPDMVDRWINRRVMPPTRHGCMSILRDIGLAEYNVFKILELTKGVCDMDPYYFEEIKE